MAMGEIALAVRKRRSSTPPSRHTLSASGFGLAIPRLISSSDSVWEIGGKAGSQSLCWGCSGTIRDGPGTFSLGLGTGPCTVRLPFLPIGSLRISTGWQSPYTLSGFLGIFLILVDLLGPKGGAGGLALLGEGGASSSGSDGGSGGCSPLTGGGANSSR